MKRIKRIRYFLIILAVFASCTKLDEKDVLYDTVIQDNFLKTDAELASAAGPELHHHVKQSGYGSGDAGPAGARQRANPDPGQRTPVDRR